MLGWRELPDRPGRRRPRPRPRWPRCRRSASCSSRRADGELSGIDLERRTFCLRKRAEHATGTYFPSLSPRTIVYKGMLAEPQVRGVLPGPGRRAGHQRAGRRALPVLHQHVPGVAAGAPVPLRRAQRRDQHAARQPQLDGRARGAAGVRRCIPGDLRPAHARSSPRTRSDSATFDEVLELLHLGGRSLPHAVLMMIPEAWENHDEMDPARRAFYEFHSTLMEPWDGPALVAFTDGTVRSAPCSTATACARPATGSPRTAWSCWPPRSACSTSRRTTIVRKGRLEPGRMFLVDTAAGRIVDDAEIKGALAAEHPYEDWLHAGLIHLDDLPAREREIADARRADPAPAGVRLHRGGAQRPAQADGRRRRRADRLDGQRRAARRHLGAAAPALTTTSSSCSRRSRTRRWTRSGRSWSPRCSSQLGPGAEPARRRRRRSCRTIVRAVPGARQRRPRQDRPHQRRRRLPRLRVVHRARRVPRRRGRRGAARAARRDPRARSRRPSRTAPG